MQFEFLKKKKLTVEHLRSNLKKAVRKKNQNYSNNVQNTKKKILQY